MTARTHTAAKNQRDLICMISSGICPFRAGCARLADKRHHDLANLTIPNRPPIVKLVERARLR